MPDQEELWLRLHDYFAPSHGELRQTFRRWYPRMKEGSEQPILLVA